MDKRLNKITLSFLILLQANLIGQINSEEVSQRNNVFFGGSPNFLEDVDGDGDLDILRIRQKDYPGKKLSIYKNDGIGNYTFFNESVITVRGSFEFFDINNDGAQDVISSAYDGEADSSTLYINDGSGNFSILKTNMPSGGYASYDMDNDGFQDLVTIQKVNYDDYNDDVDVFVTIYYNDYSVSGNFIKNVTDTFVDNNVWDGNGRLQVADLNGDGFGEIILSGKTFYNAASPVSFDFYNIVILENDSNKSFLWSTEFGRSSGKFSERTHFRKAIIEDFNKDNKLDLMLCESNMADNSDSSRVYIYYNDGNGVFGEGEELNAFQKLHLPDYIVFDIDNDGDMDVVLLGPVGTVETPNNINQPGRNWILIYKNNGWGDFSYQSYKNAAYNTGWRSKVGDIDGDGLKDFINQDYNRETLDIYKNIGGNAFIDFHQDSITPIIGRPFLVGDLNNDRYSDLYHGGNYYLDSEGNAFNPNKHLDDDSYEEFFESLLDYNGDGYLDHLTWENSYFRLDSNSGNMEELFIKWNNLNSYSSDVLKLTTGNINNDDKEEIVYVSKTNEVYELSYNSSNGDFNATSLFTLPELTSIFNIELFDFDTDGINDLFIWDDEWYPKVLAYQNDGYGNFTLQNDLSLWSLSNNRFIRKSLCDACLNYFSKPTEFLFTAASDGNGLIEYSDYGYYEHTNLRDTFVLNAVQGTFDADDFKLWTAIYYEDPNDYQKKIALSYEGQTYNLESVNSLFDFSNDWNNITQMQTIDLKDDKKSELIIAGYDFDFNYIKKIYKIYLNPITNTPHIAAKEVSVFPNPTTDWVNIDLEENEIKLAKVNIYSSSGSLVLSKDNITESVTSINIESLAKGIYFLNLYLDSRTEVYKIIKR